MGNRKKFLVDVGIENLPYPIKAISKLEKDGQPTVAHISVIARIMQEFEPIWIDTFIHVLHKHREKVKNLKEIDEIVNEFKDKLKASSVELVLNYPYFVEKITPVSKEKCLVMYNCSSTAKITGVEEKISNFFRVEIPVITTYPASSKEKPGGLFGQLSRVIININPKTDIYVEDIVEVVDKHALSPIYSYHSEEDQIYLINRIHSEEKTSVEMVDEIKNELAKRKDIKWYSVQCYNYGMLHSYNTIITIEKSLWVPFSGSE